ncbi:cytochrome-c peroxidase [Skermanella pratensis]|uniref:cytochrome-c peroxidase n=1 Tax=Skermanella pratensis TaxID=2233999 RepID=UPI0013019786|nr:cytochrome c peroxidase [Skermanella pratensis]
MRITKTLFAVGFGAAMIALVQGLGTPPVLAQGRADHGEELDALKEAYRRPAALAVANQALVDLGGRLFWDTRLSASGKTSCGSCHFPDAAWAATDPRSLNDSGKPTSRKSQPLVGLGHADGAPVGWDGKSATLEAQAKSSIATGSMSMRETDTPVEVAVIEERVRAVPDYVSAFGAALPGSSIDIDAIVTAIAAYERTIEPGVAPFDRWVEGDETAISDSAKRGFLLFNTAAGCSACHGGWRFTDDAFHDIGTTTTDLGRGRQDKADGMMQYAFKTPTLRSVAVRPPFMHNGSSSTLYDVVVHYEKGGIARPSRSPAMVPLELDEQGRTDLVEFMKTLTGVEDGGAARIPVPRR